MKLSESQLFAIESLNRIEGFEWPEWAQFVEVDVGNKIAIFKRLIDGKTAHMHGINISPDCGGAGCLVSVTKDEFKSVDGWVRNDLRLIPDCAYEKRVDFVDPECVVWIDYDATMLEWAGRSDGGYVVKWRYHKPQTQVKQPTTQPVSNIESLISQHKSARLSTLEARRQLEQAEAAEHSLLLSIEAWAESNGFDIRLLDDSEENPELVITDWRDLQEGDVVWWEGNERWKDGEYIVGDVESKDYDGSLIFSLLISKYRGDWVKDHQQWKFIRRPAK